MKRNKQRMYDNTTILKALEEVDKDLAIKVISDPNLDGNELSEIIECSMLEMIVNKDTGKPMQLSKEVMMAGLRNKLNQIIRDAESEI